MAAAPNVYNGVGCCRIETISKGAVFPDARYCQAPTSHFPNRSDKPVVASFSRDAVLEASAFYKNRYS